MFSLPQLPLELLSKIVSSADTSSCVNLSSVSHELHTLVKYNVSQTIGRELGANATDYLISFYSPNNKVSSTEKYYYEFSVVSEDDNFVEVKLNDLVLKKDLLTEFTKSNDSRPLDEPELSASNIPLLINEDSQGFKVSFAVLRKDLQGSRCKLLEMRQRFDKHAKTESSKGNQFYQIKYSLAYQGVEPPKYDYDYEMFENWGLKIISLKINKMYLLSKIESYL